MRETTAKIQPAGQRDPAQDCGRDARTYPSPEAIESLLGFAERVGPLLEYDPCGFIELLLSPNGEAHPIGVKASDRSDEIFKHIKDKGLPNNPESKEALKEIFSPTLLRHAIWRAFDDSYWHRLPHELVALCFVFNPKATLEEISFLKYQPYKSPGGISVWSIVAKGLIQGCLIKPTLWATLEPRQKSLIKGPDIIANYLRDAPLGELIELPASCVRAALKLRKPPSESDLTNEFISVSDRLDKLESILKTPGLLPVLRYLRSIKEPLPSTLVNGVINATRGATAGYSTSLNISNWELREKNGEPMRERDQAVYIREHLIDNLMKWEEFSSRFYHYDLNNLSSIKDRLVAEASSEVEKVLMASGKFTQAEIYSVLEHLGSFEKDNDLGSIKELAECVLNKKKYKARQSPLPLTEIAILLATGKIEPQYLVTETLRRRDNDFVNVDCKETLLGVLLRDTEPSEVASELKHLFVEFSIPCLAKWEHLPERPDQLLYRTILAFGTKLFSEYDEIAKVLSIWQPDLKDGLSKETIPRLTKYFSHNELCRGLFYALTKISNTDERFVNLREDLLERLTARAIDAQPFLGHALEAARMMLYRNSSKKALEPADQESGKFSYICSLKLSSEELASFPTNYKELAEKINYSLGRHLSSLNLENAPFVCCDDSFFQDWTAHQKNVFQGVASTYRDLNHETSATQRLIQAVKIISDANKNGATLENLRRRLVKPKLIKYSKHEINPADATAFYLTKFGIKPLVDFAPIELLKQALNAGPSGVRTQIRDLGSAPKRHFLEEEPKPEYVIARPAGTLQDLLKRYSHELKNELPLPHRLTVSKVFFGHSSERWALREPLFEKKWRIAGALILGQAAWYSSRRIWPGNTSRGDIGSDPSSPDGLTPNGRVPSDGILLAKINSPLPSREQSYLVRRLIGADSAGPSQPPLNYPGSDELYKIIADSGKRRLHCQIDMLINEVRKGSLIAAPLGAKITDSSGTIIEDGDGRFKALKDANDLTVILLIPDGIPELLDAEAMVVRNRLGQRHLPLSKPRLPFSAVKELSPQLAECIETARKMKAAEAAGYLRTKVSEIIKYEESPEYNTFSGSFREYLALIFKNGRGICGQFACIYDEALKHAGIPSTIVSAFVPEKDGFTYTTNGGHATNVVFLLSREGRIVPVIMDATGAAADVNSPIREQRDKISLEDFKLPATVAVATGLTGLLLAFLKRRAQVREAEILERLQPDSVIHEEPEQAKLEDDQPANEPNEPTRAVQSRGAPPRITKAEVLAKWERSFDLIEGEQEQDRKSEVRSSFDSPEFAADLDALIADQLEMINERTRRLHNACEILDRSGIVIDGELVTIIDLWIQAMNDPEYRTKWIEHINKFKKPEGRALKIFASHIFPELGDSFGSGSILSRFFNTKPRITEDLLCRSLVPLGK